MMHESASVLARRDAVAQFDFRNLHPQLKFGTASDRYAGWIGQVYPEVWRTQVERRTKKTEYGPIQEETLPIESVVDYFDHFSVLEVDFTFYRPLLDPDGKAAANYHTLQQYAQLAPPHAQFLIKAPQLFFARTLRKQRKGEAATFIENPLYLNATAYRTQFYEPLAEVLGDRVRGILFQQEYQRKQESGLPEAFFHGLDQFFSQVPLDLQGHVEIRSEHFLLPAYFDLLAKHRLGFAFSHWTWLPPIRTQWNLCGQQFYAGNGDVVLRLLSPRNMSYADAFMKAYPFTKPVPELAETAQAKEMINEATALAYQAIQHGATLNVVLNNRAYGNSPSLAQSVGHRFLDFAARKGA